MMKSNLSAVLQLAALLIASFASVCGAHGVVERQNNQLNQFSGTADQVANYDPHDYVPEHYSKVRVAHAVLMSTVWLVVFPLGGIIPRIMSDPRLIWVHAIMQMIGFWIVAGAAGMGIWMANEINHLSHYHPVIGMILLGLLCFQPATEIANHRFYQNHPKVIIAAHVHLWLGRALLVMGAVQGGLGFIFAASFHNAVVEAWPRATYAAVAAFVWTFYIIVGIIYPEIRESLNSRSKKGKKTRTQAVSAGEMENLRVGGVRHAPVGGLISKSTGYAV